MLYPSINLLRSKAESSYILVTMAAKRARDLIDGKPKLTSVESSKPVTIATNEIAEDLITYINPTEEELCQEEGVSEDAAAVEETTAAEEASEEAAAEEAPVTEEE